MAGWVEEALRRCAERGIADPVPAGGSRAPRPRRPRRRRCRSIHAPDSMREKEMARRRLAFDELLRVQLVLVLRKRELERRRRRSRPRRRRRARAALPRCVALPAHGRAAARRSPRSSRDLAAPHPMHRLLQGDVGSGKTVVALSMLLAAVQGGHQGALMAPTEVLAEQHATGRAGAARRPEGARPRQPVRRPTAAGRAAHQPGHRRRPQGDPGGSRRRLGRHRHRHPRAHPGGGRFRQPRCGRRRRAAPVRCRAAGRPARRSPRRSTCPTCW